MKNFFCNTNLLVILFIRVGVVSINNNSRILKVLFLIFLPEKTKIFVVIIRNSFPVFVYGTAKNCVCKLISCCLYFPASVNKTMSALSCNNRVKHNCKVTTGRVFHTCRNFHTADSKTVLLILNRTCTYCYIRKQIGQIAIVLRIEHLICACHSACLDSMDVHLTDCDKSGKKVRLFFGIRLMNHTLIALSCCSRFVCINTRNDQNLVGYFFLNIA